MKNKNVMVSFVASFIYVLMATIAVMVSFPKYVIVLGGLGLSYRPTGLAPTVDLKSTVEKIEKINR